MATIREKGIERRVSPAEAFLLHVTKQGLEGNGVAARAEMAAIADARAARSGEANDVPFITTYVRSGSVSQALEASRMARKLDRYRDTARTAH